MKPEDVRIVLFYKHFKKYTPGMSHIGLGNNALFTAKVLAEYGIDAEPVGVNTVEHMYEELLKRPLATHCVIEGTWIEPAAIETLVAQFRRVTFTCREHSQLSFLTAQRDALSKLRGYAPIYDRSLNFVLSANATRFCRWFEQSYSQKCLDLPNLYPVAADVIARRRVHRVPDTLKISAFGAARILKNLSTAAGAALMIGNHLGRDIELHINVGREPGLDNNIRIVRQVMANVPGAKLIEHTWTEWSTFRHWCGAMDLGLAPTFTETFCLTAADHIAHGVPVVGSDAIEWLPKRWQAMSDSPEDVCSVGISLLTNPYASEDGRAALVKYQFDALEKWFKWLKVDLRPKLSPV